MRNVHTTSSNAYHAHLASGRAGAQGALILNHIQDAGGDWSIGELARALDMEKSTVSARVNELLNDNPPQLVAAPKRQDKVSGITVRPVALRGARA